MFKHFINSSLRGQLPVLSLLGASLFYLTFGSQTALYYSPMQGPLYSLATNLIKDNITVVRLLTLALLLGNGLLFNELFKLFRIMPRRNFTILFFWLYYLLCFPVYLAFTPQLFASVLMLYAIFLFFKFSSEESQIRDLISINLIFSFAALIYRPLMFYVIFVPIALMLLRRFGLRYFVVSVLSFALPFLYLWTWYFIKDEGSKFQLLFDFRFTDLESLTAPFHDYRFAIPFAGSALIFFAGFQKVLFSIQSKLIQTRIIVSFIMGFLLFNLLLVIFFPVEVKYSLFLLFFPSVAIQSMGFMELKKGWLLDVVLGVFLIVSLGLNYL